MGQASRGISRHGRIETRCDSHQGHVLKDGPAPTRLLYSIDSVSREFVKTGGRCVTSWGSDDEFPHDRRRTNLSSQTFTSSTTTERPAAKSSSPS